MFDYSHGLLLLLHRFELLPQDADHLLGGRALLLGQREVVPQLGGLLVLQRSETLRRGNGRRMGSVRLQKVRPRPGRALEGVAEP